MSITGLHATSGPLLICRGTGPLHWRDSPSMLLILGRPPNDSYVNFMNSCLYSSLTLGSLFFQGKLNFCLGSSQPNQGTKFLQFQFFYCSCGQSATVHCSSYRQPNQNLQCRQSNKSSFQWSKWEKDLSLWLLLQVAIRFSSSGAQISLEGGTQLQIRKG